VIKSNLQRWRAAAKRRLLNLNPPCQAEDWQPSLIASLHDDQACQKLPALNDVLKAVSYASTLHLTESDACRDSRFFNVFPGEHYKLLAALVSIWSPRLLFDIGTFTGMSARVMLDFASANAIVHSFDLLAWQDFSTHLSLDDFASGRLFQHLQNLAQPDIFEFWLPQLQLADIIFCDGPKDGLFEQAFLGLLAAAPLQERPRWLLLDDIRFLQMVNLWRRIDSPKIDLTSFGHWSGTGLVDISNGLSLRAL
jgi:hypothetical protein